MNHSVPRNTNKKVFSGTLEESMNIKQSILAALVLALMLAAPAVKADGNAVPQPSPQLLDSGKDLFQQKCVTCHGPNGEGNGPAGMYLTPKPRNFKADAFKKGDDPAHVYEAISQGLANSAMPAFSDLSAQERWGLVYYVLSIRGKVDAGALARTPQSQKTDMGRMDGRM